MRTNINNNSLYEKLNNTECIRAYSPKLIADRRNLVLVTNSSIPDIFDQYVALNDKDWICNGFDWYDGIRDKCDTTRASQESDAWVYVWAYVPVNRTGSLVDYCLSERTPSHCKVQYSVNIMTIVIISNLVKVICMSLTVWKQKEPTLTTLG